MHPLVILVDVDHTLLDGDGVRAALATVIEARAGRDALAPFWAHYEAVRSDLDGVDLPETARRLEVERGLPPGSLLPDLCAADFASCLQPGALAALEHLARLGLTVVLSDGDARFQRAKIAVSGIEAAVEGRVLVVPHKERAIQEVTAAYPAAHYALLDDRVSILGAVKARLGQLVTTVHVRQGRYAGEPRPIEVPPPDLELTSIDAARHLDARALAGGAAR